ncbi:MAG: mechanosensitive ion channel [Candidatus Zixiibacteriota bacterium]
MKLSDVLETINQVSRYVLFEFNNTPVTPASIIVFVLVIIGFYILARIIARVLSKKLLPRFDIDRGIQFTMTRMTQYLIMILGVVIAFQFVGFDLSGLAVVLGFLSVGIGFGLQNITSNFVSGLILLFERPIKIGDRVTVGDTEGDVLSINMRATTIRSLQNISIIVPNSEFISSNVINWSHGDPTVRMRIDVGVSYDSDLDAVIQALEEVAREHPEVHTDPPPKVLHLGFGDSAWNMRLLALISDPKRYYPVLSDLNCAIVRKFRERGIEIPFPQRDLHVRSPLPVPLSQEMASTS